MAADPHAETVNRVIQALRDERKKKGLSQERLATMAGLSRTGVRHVESGQFRPTLYTMLKLAEALDLDFPGLLRKVRSQRV